MVLWLAVIGAVFVGPTIAPSSADPLLRVPAIRVDQASRRQFSADIDRIARRHRLDPALLHAVVTVESGYDPHAVSPAGAMGLMQLMPETAERFQVSDPFEPLANLDAGARYLRLLLDRFGTIQLALAAYHAGEGRVQRARRTIPPIPATRRYVVSVIHHFMRYRRD